MTLAGSFPESWGYKKLPFVVAAQFLPSNVTPPTPQDKMLYSEVYRHGMFNLKDLPVVVYYTIRWNI